MATKTESPYSGCEIQQKWIIQCKRYTKKPPSVPELEKSISWCEGHKPDYLLFIITNILSPDTKDFLDEIKEKHHFRILTWERPLLESQIIQYLDDLKPHLPQEFYSVISKAKLKPPFKRIFKLPRTPDWHEIPEFKESNKLFEDNNMIEETARLGEISFLEMLVGRLKTRNLIRPNKKIAFPITIFEATVKDVLEYLTKLQDNKCAQHLEPTISRLNEKNVTNTLEHTTRELIKHMFARGLVSGPGDYVVVY